MATAVYPCSGDIDMVEADASSATPGRHERMPDAAVPAPTGAVPAPTGAVPAPTAAAPTVEGAPAPVPSERSGSRGGSIPLPAPAPEVGFTQPVLLAFGMGIALLLFTGLLRTAATTSDGPSDGMVDTSIWFGWLGASLLSLALIGAGLTSRAASPGARVAFLLVGSYLFMQASNGYGAFASILGALF